jgi:hypothetical protein
LPRTGAALTGLPLALGGKAAAGGRNRYPYFLPDGRRFLYTNLVDPKATGIYVGSLDGTPPVRILPDPSVAAYAPPGSSGGSGHLLFRRGNTLMVQPFDPDRLRIPAEMFPLVEGVGNISVSENGVLAYQTGDRGALAQDLTWMDRTGKQIESAGPRGVYNNFRLAPDEKRIVFDRTDPSNSNQDICVLDMPRGVTSRLTFDPGVDNLPIWSPDGSRVVFPSRQKGPFDLYIKARNRRGPSSATSPITPC